MDDGENPSSVLWRRRGQKPSQLTLEGSLGSATRSSSRIAGAMLPLLFNHPSSQVFLTEYAVGALFNNRHTPIRSSEEELKKYQEGADAMMMMY